MERIMRRPKSREVFEEAKLTLAGGVGSSSRVYPEPLIVECAKGSRVYDIDGNEYVDLLCAYGLAQHLKFFNQPVNRLGILLMGNIEDVIEFGFKQIIDSTGLVTFKDMRISH